MNLKSSKKDSKESLNKSWNNTNEAATNGVKGLTKTASAPFIETFKVVASDESKLSSYSDEEAKINMEIDLFVEDLKKTLEIYINRMKSDSLRGRSITNDTAVQSLFLQLQHMHPKLLSYVKYQEDARGYYENLQDKLTQLKDAREALNALRHENFEKKKRDIEEKERWRQIQIAQKLQLMRQQKQVNFV